MPLPRVMGPACSSRSTDASLGAAMLPRIPVVRVRASGVRVAIWPLDTGAVWNRQAATDRLAPTQLRGLSAVGGRRRKPARAGERYGV